MKIRSLLWSACLTGGMALFSVPLAAANARECVPGRPTAASYHWNFKQEANGIFDEVQREVRDVADHAARLQSFGDSPDITWEAHAEQLTQVKDGINDIGERLCRLETIRRELAPWQQKTVDNIAVRAREAAANTEEAIRFLNAHQGDLWMPDYQEHIRNLYSEAHSLQQSAGEAVQYAQVANRYQALRNDLGLKRTS